MEPTTLTCKEHCGTGRRRAQRSLNKYKDSKQGRKQHWPQPGFQNKAGNDNSGQDRLGGRTAKGATTVQDCGTNWDFLTSCSIGE